MLHTLTGTRMCGALCDLRAAPLPLGHPIHPSAMPFVQSHKMSFQRFSGVNALEKRRTLEEERKSRILDDRSRGMGIDVAVLDAQVCAPTSLAPPPLPPTVPRLCHTLSKLSSTAPSGAATRYAA